MDFHDILSMAAQNQKVAEKQVPAGMCTLKVSAPKKIQKETNVKSAVVRKFLEEKEKEKKAKEDKERRKVEAEVRRKQKLLEKEKQKMKLMQEEEDRKRLEAIKKAKFVIPKIKKDMPPETVTGTSDFEKDFNKKQNSPLDSASTTEELKQNSANEGKGAKQRPNEKRHDKSEPSTERPRTNREKKTDKSDCSRDKSGTSKGRRHEKIHSVDKNRPSSHSEKKSDKNLPSSSKISAINKMVLDKDDTTVEQKGDKLLPGFKCAENVSRRVALTPSEGKALDSKTLTQRFKEKLERERELARQEKERLAREKEAEKESRLSGKSKSSHVKMDYQTHEVNRTYQTDEVCRSGKLKSSHIEISQKHSNSPSSKPSHSSEKLQCTESKHSKVKVKKTNMGGAPPMSFEEILKLAENKSRETPSPIDWHCSKLKSDEPDRPLTQREKEKLQREQESQRRKSLDEEDSDREKTVVKKEKVKGERRKEKSQGVEKYKANTVDKSRTESVKNKVRIEDSGSRTSSPVNFLKNKARSSGNVKNGDKLREKTPSPVLSAKNTKRTGRPNKSSLHLEMDDDLPDKMSPEAIMAKYKKLKEMYMQLKQKDSIKSSSSSSKNSENKSGVSSLKLSYLKPGESSSTEKKRKIKDKDEYDEENENVLVCGPSKEKKAAKLKTKEEEEEEEKSSNPWDRIYGQIQKNNPKREKRKRQVIDSDSEYDSEMDDFIVDGDEEDNEDIGGGNYSKYIREIFGYDRSKFKNENWDDVDNMETGFAAQMKEEARSARLGLMEDLEDMKQEEEELKKKAARKKMKKRK